MTRDEYRERLKAVERMVKRALDWAADTRARGEPMPDFELVHDGCRSDEIEVWRIIDRRELDDLEEVTIDLSDDEDVPLEQRGFGVP